MITAVSKSKADIIIYRVYRTIGDGHENKNTLTG